MRCIIEGKIEGQWLWINQYDNLSLEDCEDILKDRLQPYDHAVRHSELRIIITRDKPKGVNYG